MEAIKQRNHFIGAAIGFAFGAVVSSMADRSGSMFIIVSMIFAAIGAWLAHKIYMLREMARAHGQIKPRVKTIEAEQRWRTTIATLEAIADTDPERARPVFWELMDAWTPALDARRCGGDKDMARKVSFAGIYGALEAVHLGGNRYYNAEIAGALLAVSQMCAELGVEPPDRFSELYGKITARSLGGTSRPPRP